METEASNSWKTGNESRISSKVSELQTYWHQNLPDPLQVLELSAEGLQADRCWGAWLTERGLVIGQLIGHVTLLSLWYFNHRIQIHTEQYSSDISCRTVGHWTQHPRLMLSECVCCRERSRSGCVCQLIYEECNDWPGHALTHLSLSLSHSHTHTHRKQ